MPLPWVDFFQHVVSNIYKLKVNNTAFFIFISQAESTLSMHIYHKSLKCIHTLEVKVQIEVYLQGVPVGVVSWSKGNLRYTVKL